MKTGKLTKTRLLCLALCLVIALPFSLFACDLEGDSNSSTTGETTAATTATAGTTASATTATPTTAATTVATTAKPTTSDRGETSEKPNIVVTRPATTNQTTGATTTESTPSWTTTGFPYFPIGTTAATTTEQIPIWTTAPGTTGSGTLPANYEDYFNSVPPTKMYICTSEYPNGNVNLRSQPIVSGDTWRKSAKDGTEVTVIAIGTGAYEGWCKIKVAREKSDPNEPQFYDEYYVGYKNLSEFKSGAATTLNEILSTYTGFTAVTKTMYVSTEASSGLNVRATPDFNNGRIIEGLQAKDAVKIVAQGMQGDVFCYVLEFTDGTTTVYGFVSAKYITPNSDGTPGVASPAVDEWVDVYDMGESGSARIINFLSVSDPADQPYNTKYYFIRHEEDEDVIAGDKMAESASTRTFYMEEAFNVAFHSIGQPSSQLFNIVQSSLMGDGGEYDLIYPHPTVGMYAFLTNGLFQNLYSFTDDAGEQIIHLDKPWWNQSQVNEFTIDDKLYIAVNDMSISAQGFYALVYNRSLYNELGIPDDLYALVKSGDWTMTKLQELAMTYGGGAGADGVLDANDKLGLLFQWQSRPYWFCGGRVISKDENGDFYLAIDTDHSNKIAKAYYDLLNATEDHVLWSTETHTYATFATTKILANFKSGNSLFFSYDLGGLYRHLWDTSFDVGYLPNPKLNTDQENYYSVCAGGFFAIPQKVKDNKVSATLLEALAIHSYTNHRINFFDDVLLARMTEKLADYKMLEFLHSTKTYDWGSHLIGASDSGTFIDVTAAEEKLDDVTDIIRGRKKSWESLIPTLEDIKNAEFAG